MKEVGTNALCSFSLSLSLSLSLSQCYNLTIYQRFASTLQEIESNLISPTFLIVKSQNIFMIQLHLRLLVESETQDRHGEGKEDGGNRDWGMRGIVLMHDEVACVHN